MIFYLSGTGNTKWAASILVQMTGERLIDITKVKEETAYFTPNTNERIGFCFPVHGWRPPLAFRRFLNKLRIDNPNNHYCYALCTAGDDIGETMDILKKDLAQHGIKLDSAFSLIMPESYVGLPFMDVDTKENEERKKVKAAKDLAIYGQFITERHISRLDGGHGSTVGYSEDFSQNTSLPINTSVLLPINALAAKLVPQYAL